MLYITIIINNMKDLRSYWFLQKPIDVEYKYYILMDFLQSVENDLNNKKYSEQIQKINRLYGDLKMFQRFQKFNDRTIKSMSQEELDSIKILMKDSQNNEEVEIIINESIKILDSFMDTLSPYLKEIGESIKFKIFNENGSNKDRGYIIMRNNKDKKLKIYSWNFSIVKIDETDQVGLLLSELLDPLPKYTKMNKKIYDFFIKEIKNFSENSGCFIIADLVSTKGEDEISFDLMKEKSIEFIVSNYKDYLALL